MKYRIGIDLGGTKIEGLLLDPKGSVVLRQRVPTPQGDYAATLRALVELVAMLDRKAEASCSVGMGTPGCTNPRDGSMTNCNSTWLNRQHLLQDLQLALGERVRLANDADCFTIAESALLGNQATVFGVILGTGVGGGLSHRGDLLAGPNGLAGEWGHTPLPYFKCDQFLGAELMELENSLANRHCYCGRDNCVETFLAGPALVAMHKQLWKENLTPQQINRGDSESAELTRRLYTHMLARSLAQIINVLDPEVIVLGGGLSNMEFLYSQVPRLWSVYTLSDCLVTELKKPSLGDSSGVFGAAQLWPP